jgi:hypothetical protein
VSWLFLGALKAGVRGPGFRSSKVLVGLGSWRGRCAGCTAAGGWGTARVLGRQAARQDETSAQAAERGDAHGHCEAFGVVHASIIGVSVQVNQASLNRGVLILVALLPG